MTLDAFIFDKFTLEFIFMCYLHLIIIFATHLNYCLHYYIYVCIFSADWQIYYFFALLSEIEVFDLMRRGI